MAKKAMSLRPVGRVGMMMPAQGYGAMGLSCFYGDHDATDVEKGEACFAKLEELRRAHGLPAMYVDTAWIYTTFQEGIPHNEELVGHAIKRYGRETLIIGDKLGVDIRDRHDMFRQSPAQLEAQLNDSLKRLGSSYIDIVYLNRPSPHLRIEDAMHTLKKFVQSGRVRYVGVSEATADDIRRAHAVHPLTAVQMEWSLFTRDIEATILPTCRELGIAIVAYSPISRGLLSGAFVVGEQSKGDWRPALPRFKEFHDENMQKVQKVKDVAAKKLHVSVAQLSLAWLHSKGEDVFPIPGSTNPGRMEENFDAEAITLTAEEIAALDAIGEAAGDRYPGMHGTHNSRAEMQKGEAAAH